MTEDEIRRKVRSLIYENMISGYSEVAKVHFHYTKPSPGTYPFQFFWDTCFHVYILTALGEEEMAKKHLLTLFSLQEEDGFVGHMIYWDRIFPGRITDFFQSKPGLKYKLFRTHMSALIQPPLAAQAVARVYKNTQDRNFLQHMLPKLKKYYYWIANSRDFEGNGLISIISPFESGMDWKPTFDPVVGFPAKKADWRLFWKVIGVDFRNFINNYNTKAIYKKDYFIVKEVGFNTVYVQNLQALAHLCDQVNDPEAERFNAMATQVIQSMINIMYDKETAAFYDVFGKNNTKIKILTPTIFFPVVIQNLPDQICEHIINSHFFNQDEFAVKYMIPSVAINHPSFNPESSLYIWRGPTWIFYNWFMHQFLMEKGYHHAAKKLIASIRELIEKSGFREYYNPFTGAGYGADDFTWAGLVVDMINMENGSTQSEKTLP